MNEAEFNRLLEKYQQGKATDNEKALLDAWFESIGYDESEFTWNKKQEDAQFQAIRNNCWTGIRLPGSCLTNLKSFYQAWTEGTVLMHNLGSDIEPIPIPPKPFNLLNLHPFLFIF